MAETLLEGARLTPAEERDFERLDASVRRLAREWLDNLLDIRDRRLYRARFRTWEEYLGDVLQSTGRRGQQILAHFRRVQVFEEAQQGEPMVHLPANERQSRELEGLEPDEQVEALLAAAAASPTGRLTATGIREAVEDLHGEDGEDEADEADADVQRERVEAAGVRAHKDADARQIEQALSLLKRSRALVAALGDRAEDTLEDFDRLARKVGALLD